MTGTNGTNGTNGTKPPPEGRDKRDNPPGARVPIGSLTRLVPPSGNADVPETLIPAWSVKPPNEIVCKNGEIFTLIKISPYVRKDGKESAIAIWKATCYYCDEEFQVTTHTGVAREEDHNNFGLRRCELHRHRRGKKRKT